jgi:hypothetical protein
VLVTAGSEHLEDDPRALRIAGRVAVDDHDVAGLCCDFALQLHDFLPGGDRSRIAEDRPGWIGETAESLPENYAANVSVDLLVPRLDVPA